MMAPIPNATNCPGPRVRLSWCAPDSDSFMIRVIDLVANRLISIHRLNSPNLTRNLKFFLRASGRYNDRLMLPIREEDTEAQRYQENLRTVRQRILGFAVRRLVPHSADFAQAEDIAQSCVVALLEQYPDKQDLSEMVRIAVGVARHKIAQCHRDHERMPGISDAAADQRESQYAHNPHSGEKVFERMAAREDVDRFLLGMLRLPERCRQLLQLKLIEEKDYAEIRGITGISGNIYEMTKRCFRTLLRNVGGSSL